MASLNYSNNGNHSQDGFLDPNWLTMLGQANTIIMTCNVITLMLGMGAATYWKEIWYHMRRPWKCLLGLACQFILLPVFGFVLCLLIPLHPYEAISVLILVCSPGGAFSNFFTYWMDGDLALSILLTTLSSLLSFGIMPLNLFLLTKHWPHETLQIPYLRIFLSLCFVSGPCIAGMILRNYSRKWATLISKICGLIGWIGAMVVGVLLILMYWPWFITTDTSYVIVAAIVPAGSACIAFIINKVVCFSNALGRTIALETGSQNMVVATNVILISFTDPEMRGRMVLFPVLYGLMLLGQVFVAIIVFQLWKFIRRDVVTEEDSPSVIDTTVLERIDVPRNQNTGGKERHRNVIPDVVRYPQQYNPPAGQISTSHQHQSRRYTAVNTTADESTAFLQPPPPSYEEVLQDDMLPYNTRSPETVFNPYMAQNMRTSTNSSKNWSRSTPININNQNTILTSVYATPVVSVSKNTYSNMNTEQNNISLTEIIYNQETILNDSPKSETTYSPASSPPSSLAFNDVDKSEIQSPFSEHSYHPLQFPVQVTLHHSTPPNAYHVPSKSIALDYSQESISQNDIMQTDIQLPEFEPFRRMTDSNLRRHSNSQATRKISEPTNPFFRRNKSKEDQPVFQGFPSDLDPFSEDNFIDYKSNSSMSDFSITDSRDSRLQNIDDITGASSIPVNNVPPNTPTSPSVTTGLHIRPGFYLEDIHEGQRSNFSPFIRRK